MGAEVEVVTRVIDEFEWEHVAESRRHFMNAGEDDASGARCAAVDEVSAVHTSKRDSSLRSE